MKTLLILLSLVTTQFSFALEQSTKNISTCKEAYSLAKKVSSENSFTEEVGGMSFVGFLGTALITGATGPISLPAAAIAGSSGFVLLMSRVLIRTPNIERMERLIDSSNSCLDNGKCNAKILRRLTNYVNRNIDVKVDSKTVAEVVVDQMDNGGCLRVGSFKDGYRGYADDYRTGGYRLKRFRHFKKDVLEELE